MKKVYMLCNAHIDPVWLWNREEGMAEALSTFRVAADFCKQFDGFVFNHNESLLYEWIEQFEPALFERIRQLVTQGKWHIMGGWYLQPDCNLPNGEGFIAQATTGLNYFKEKFGVRPTTAINFDPFGHSRGLVQILKKCGYDSYIFQRDAEDGDFVWQGYDGSQIVAHRIYDGYLSARGQAVTKLDKYINNYPDHSNILLLWGIGNHGGGPSKEDLIAIEQYRMAHSETQIMHATPEQYFADIETPTRTWDKHIGPSMVGCYTSMAKVKQCYRRLESMYLTTQSMLTNLSAQGVMDYPKEKMTTVLKDMLFNQFHDILPGSCIKSAEQAAIEMMSRGITTLGDLRIQAFFKFANGQKTAAEQEIPIMVHNPYPYEIKTLVHCEYQLADQNWTYGEFTAGDMYQNSVQIPCQYVKEDSSMNLDWRKKVVFQATLAPMQTSRFDIKLKLLKNAEVDPNNEFLYAPRFIETPDLVRENENSFVFDNGEMQVTINKQTGLIDSYIVNGIPFAKPGFLQLQVYHSSPDPWGMRVTGYADKAGDCTLLSPQEGSRVSGIFDNVIPSVRLIENGTVLAEIEAVFGYEDSVIFARYQLPAKGTDIDYSLRAVWNAPDKMLKLALPTTLDNARFIGQTAFGQETLPMDGMQQPAQKWIKLEQNDKTLALLNDGVYGCDAHDGAMYATILHSPSYAAHPIENRVYIPKDRALPRIDTGEHSAKFKVCINPQSLDLSAEVFNSPPMALSFFPCGAGEKLPMGMELSNKNVLMTAFKPAMDGGGYIVRLFDSIGTGQSATLAVLGLQATVTLSPFEVQTLKIDLAAGTVTPCAMTE